MDYIYSISLFLLLLLLIAIDYICRLRKERRELCNYYDVLLTNILKGKHRGKGLSNEKTKVIFGYSDTKQLEEAIKKDKEKLELVKLDEKELDSEKVKAQGVFVGLNGYSTFKKTIETNDYDVDEPLQTSFLE